MSSHILKPGDRVRELKPGLSPHFGTVLSRHRHPRLNDVTLRIRWDDGQWTQWVSESNPYIHRWTKARPNPVKVSAGRRWGRSYWPSKEELEEVSRHQAAMDNILTRRPRPAVEGRGVACFVGGPLDGKHTEIPNVNIPEIKIPIMGDLKVDDWDKGFGSVHVRCEYSTFTYVKVRGQKHGKGITISGDPADPIYWVPREWTAPQ